MANEELVRSVKEIIGRAKTGDTDGAYRGYRDLFASAAFAGYRVEDQRQALQLMVLMKGAPKPATATMVEAHRAAQGLLSGLVRATPNHRITSCSASVTSCWGTRPALVPCSERG